MTGDGAARLLVALDTASDIAGAALMEDGLLLAESTWRTHQSHSRQLMPTLEWLLERAGRSKDDIGAVAVCLGPGMYAGLRVGLSTAKALSYGLDVPVLGLSRLAADAYPVALATGGRVVALHTAGRAEVAVATYEVRGEELIEIEAPHLVPLGELLRAVAHAGVVCGETVALSADLKAGLQLAGARLVEAPAARAVAIARLAHRRLARNDVDDAASIVPLYLRAPAIGPQS